MNLNILHLPAPPHTIAYWATDSCALLWYTRSTPLRIPIKTFLVICTSPRGGACLQCMPTLDLKSTRKTNIPVRVLFDDTLIHRCWIAWHSLLCERQPTSTNGGQAVLSSASDKICEWSLSVATSCVHKVCTPTTSMSSTSTSSPSCCIERGKIRDRELCNWWLYCWRRLVGCVALGCECSKLLLRGLLICMELVDCCRYQC